MTPPSVLLICNSFGREAQARFLTDELADAMAESGARVQMAVIDWNGPLGAPTEYLVKPNGVEVVVIAPRSVRGLGRVLALSTKWLGSSLFGVAALRNHFAGRRIDLIVGFSPLIVTWFTILWAKAAFRSRTYSHIVDFFPYHQIAAGLVPRSISRVGVWLETCMMRRFDAVACMSPDGVAFLRRHYHLRPEQATPVLRLWGAIDPVPPVDRIAVRAAHGLPSDRFIIVFGGLIAEGRGVADILAAASLTAAERPDILFLFVGRGRLEPVVRDHIAAGGSNVALRDALPRAEYLTLIAACDLGLVSTVAGTGVPTFPSKTMDYLRAGLPVVASVETTTDYRDFVRENGFGVVVNAGDPVALSKALCELTLSPERRSHMVNRGYATLVEHFDVAVAAGMILESVASPGVRRG